MAETILITDRVDPICLKMLEDAGIDANLQTSVSPDELREHAATADGWIIRSGTRITSDLISAAGRLKVIGRAGVGVDNIDLDAATRRGILVINAPDGNTISTAEHACAMLMALARSIPAANASLREGRWDRKSFTGSELYQKTLGIVGVGKIGQAVAQRMRHFGMKLVGFDPVLSTDVASRLGVDLVDLDALLAQSDFITLHAPLNEATKKMLNAGSLAKCKRGVRIVNCARGGLIDEQALLDALETGQVGGAALDVYSQEPPPEHIAGLIGHPRVVATPHIAASTEEAQTKVAEQVTEQVVKALRGEAVSTSVNAAAIRLAASRDVRPFVALADKLGQIAVQLVDGHVNRLTVRCVGDVPHRYPDVLTIAVVRGVLSRLMEGPINMVNASMIAEEMGLRVSEQTEREGQGYRNLIEVELETDHGRRAVAGTLFADDDPRVVRIDEYGLELRPDGYMLLYRNEDRPGMLAAVGAVLAAGNINIGSMALGRMGKGSIALTAIHVDEPVPDPLIEEISALSGVEGVRQIQC